MRTDGGHAMFVRVSKKDFMDNDSRQDDGGSNLTGTCCRHMPNMPHTKSHENNLMDKSLVKQNFNQQQLLTFNLT